MPKYDNLADHFKAKWQGQLARCKGQANTIASLNLTILEWEKTFLDKHSQYCASRQEVGQLRGRVKELEERMLINCLSID
jgi:hypothetical protein